jgi:hypothetical protein
MICSMTLVYELSPYYFSLTRPACHIYERSPQVNRSQALVFVSTKFLIKVINIISTTILFFLPVPTLPITLETVNIAGFCL